MKFLQGQIILRNLYVNVVRCILKNNSDTQNSDYTIPFHTFLKCGTKVCKIISNKANSLNIVSKFAIARINLTSAPHPRLSHIPWVYDTTLLIYERSLIHIQMDDYLTCVWCDLLPMNISHILFGFLWLQEIQAYHNMQNNTYF